MFASSDDEVYKESVLPSFKKNSQLLSGDSKRVKTKKIKPIVLEETRELNPEEQKREQARQEFDLGLGHG